MNTIKCYRELIAIPTFIDRLLYLQLGGEVGRETYGHQRFINQAFYRSAGWKQVRSQAIIRDQGNDLAFPNTPIFGRCIVHHINPITERDISLNRPCIYDLDNLICVSESTDRAIHYQDSTIIAAMQHVVRKPNDHILWR